MPLQRLSSPAPQPETATFNEADEDDLGFVIRRPVGYNLEQAKDPLSDIKRRERDLQHERIARESELQREYEKRLQEFELDF